MSDQSSFKEWLLRTTVAALFAVLGFFGRDFYENWKQERQAEESSLIELRTLASLLDESLSIYRAQNYQAQQLMKMIWANHADAPKDLGYDDTFYEMHDRLSREEGELQGIIRSTTMNSMRRVNETMSSWLRRNSGFRSDDQPTHAQSELAKALRALELHLNQWHDKYAATMSNVRRSLVYLADEDAHGTGFPTGIELLVRHVIDERSGRP